ncbi:SDR family oxidoreductase [Streptomyces albipurpureus]|uniref:SDR family oxidoreductase n=1 Tax=Streptomyces albipurpureus TaxID=2897419 RepID=A0ABT0UNC3_9ACTN|nr:SDR family oxidoreductase [Streptomyces sp. CWNU-1]MCM2390124.1 SDR family oxidoreductase [Streptomyces sp. CWNU-1]
MPPVIAVTGASGRIGGRVAARLAEQGQAVRLLGRNPARLPRIAGGSIGPAASYGNGEAMRAACDGVKTLFLVSAQESQGRVREHMTAVDAAVAAGVERLVYVSFLGASPDATFTFARDHWHTEEYIRASSLRYTFLRDSFYLDALARMAGADGVIRGPAGAGRVSAVAHDDIADSAVGVLLGEGHDSATYDITGPTAITLTEAADELTRFAGRPVVYQPESEDEAYASRSIFGAESWEVAGWVTSYEAIASGELAAVSDSVPKLAGHPAQTFTDFLRANPESYAHLRP